MADDIKVIKGEKGSYEVYDPMGEGAFGSVFIGADEDFNSVALK
jgi:hypothetical protein